MSLAHERIQRFGFDFKRDTLYLDWGWPYERFYLPENFAPADLARVRHLALYEHERYFASIYHCEYYEEWLAFVLHAFPRVESYAQRLLLSRQRE